MLRLTLMLGTAIYAILVVVPERLPDNPPPAADVARSAIAVGALVPDRPVARDRLVTADGRTLSIAAVIDPSAVDAGTGPITLVSTRRPDQAETAETVVASASGGQPEGPLVEVTGTQVNLRAGPSTDTAVLGAMVRGERAELIAASGGGWAQIRVVSTGTIGYMADRFLSPVN